MSSRQRPTKTLRFRLQFRPQANAWFCETHALFNQVAAFYFDVLQSHPRLLKLNDQSALTQLERLTHATKHHPDPALPLAEIAPDVPAMFRRAAIHAALGSGRSFFSNLERWREHKAKAEARGRPFRLKPPVPPRAWNKSPVWYAGMYKDFGPHTVMLKVWTGVSWAWVKFRLSGRAWPEGWKPGSPQVVQRGRHWQLHVPFHKDDFQFPAKARKQLADPQTRLCAVDLNVNDALAVCTIQTPDGKVIATRFIRGGRELQGRRKRALGRVARHRSQSGVLRQGQTDNALLFRYLRATDDDAAHRVSRRIVDFAREHGATIIVFEYLGHFEPVRGKYTRRGNQKRACWLRGRIFHHTQYKAWAEGSLTCRVSPRDTSRRCADCGQAIARHREGEAPVGYRPGAPLYSCPHCLKRGNAERNASLNVGHRLIERYSQKPRLKGRGVSLSQGSSAENASRPHNGSERQGERDGQGTARMEMASAVSTPSRVSRSLRPQGSCG